jgi:hypothetical protein
MKAESFSISFIPMLSEVKIMDRDRDKTLSFHPQLLML